MKGPLKTHGGKHYLAQKIIALMPPHTHFVAVLLAKSCEGVSEVVNDLDGNFTNFWQVLQDDGLFAQFQRRVQAIPFSEVEWRKALQAPSSEDPVERATRFFVLCRQSMSGRCHEFSPLTRNRTRGGMNEQASSWVNAIDGLPAVHARLQRVVILNKPALEVLRSQDGPGSLMYLDPPYVPDTRTSKKTFGPFEMSVEQHEELLDAITGLQGLVMISGYASELYDSKLAAWDRREFELPNNASNGKQKRRMKEVVWSNFNIAEKEAAA
jgi:DNA adenine methylase